MLKITDETMDGTWLIRKMKRQNKLRQYGCVYSSDMGTEWWMKKTIKTPSWWIKSGYWNFYSIIEAEPTQFELKKWKRI